MSDHNHLSGPIDGTALLTDLLACLDREFRREHLGHQLVTVLDATDLGALLRRIEHVLLMRDIARINELLDDSGNDQ